eukprot:scaffold6397_cov121-Isochrysis_galbana.AAC.5
MKVVVAQHAGYRYRLMEINASDDRSDKMLKQRIKDATEVQPVFGTRKPVLIVLDEIDGAMGGSDGSGAIAELLRLASATGAGRGGVEEHGSKSKRWDLNLYQFQIAKSVRRPAEPSFFFVAFSAARVSVRYNIYNGYDARHSHSPPPRPPLGADSVAVEHD